MLLQHVLYKPIEILDRKKDVCDNVLPALVLQCISESKPAYETASWKSRSRFLSWKSKGVFCVMAEDSLKSAVA